MLVAHFYSYEDLEMLAKVFFKHKDNENPFWATETRRLFVAFGDGVLRQTENIWFFSTIFSRSSSVLCHTDNIAEIIERAESRPAEYSTTSLQTFKDYLSYPKHQQEGLAITLNVLLHSLCRTCSVINSSEHFQGSYITMWALNRKR